MPLIYPQLDGVKVNPDRSLPTALIQAIRKAYDYIAQTQATAVEVAAAPGPDGGDGGGTTPPEATGPVTGFTFVGEVGTRYADEFDRLQHLTIGFTPIMPVPQTVTYLISNDAKATWVWIGSQEMKTANQVLRVDRLAMVDDANWAVAALAGNHGGDPRPILNAALDLLYPDAVVSPLFLVKGLAKPLENQGIVATIGGCTNVVTSDGLTQYGRIPGVIYTDPPKSLDWVVCITVTDLDAAFAPISIEKTHNYTQITGGEHELNELLVTYRPGLAYIQYKFYVVNRANKDPYDFLNEPTSTLQYVIFNAATPAVTHFEVPITIPHFTPVDPTDVFNVLTVTGSEVGPKYQDEKAGLHTVVALVVTVDTDFLKAHSVTFWLDFGDGKPVWQGSYQLTYENQVTRIGDQTLGSDGTQKSGTIWVPTNAAHGTWKVWAAPGRIDKGADPRIATWPSSTFTVTPIKACSPTGITNCHFNPDPATSDLITYSKWEPGIWYWEYFQLEWTPPTQLVEPDFWFALITVQKGATIAGVWTPAPDAEGRNTSPTLSYLGRVHDEVATIPGLAIDQVAVMQRNGAFPATWVIPPNHQSDLVTPNPYREFRFLIYSVSRLGSDSSGSGGAGTYTLQTSCWPGGKSYYILTPVAKNGDLDLTNANPNSVTGALKGGAGQPLDVKASGITGSYIADDAIQARHMAENSITFANKAIDANAIVDANVIDVGVSKLISGTNIFTGDVILSRGSSKPVIVLNNSGINLFGVSDSGTVPPGAAGLLSKPNVAIASTGIVLFSGVGNSLQITSSAVTIYTVNGDLTKPYLSMSANGLYVTSGDVVLPALANTLALDSTGITVQDKLGAKFTVNAGKLTLSRTRSSSLGTTTTTIDDLGMSIVTGNVGATNYLQLTMNSSGINISAGPAGGASVTITSSAVIINKGSLLSPDIAVSSGSVTVNINITDYVKVTDSTAGSIAQMTGQLVTIYKIADNFQRVNLGYNGIGVAGPGGTPVSQLIPNRLTMGSIVDLDGSVARLRLTLDGGSNIFEVIPGAIKFNTFQVLSTRKPGPGFPGDFSNPSNIRLWCIALYEALSAAGGTGAGGGVGHGLIT